MDGKVGLRWKASMYTCQDRHRLDSLTCSTFNLLRGFETPKAQSPSLYVWIETAPDRFTLSALCVQISFKFYLFWFGSSNAHRFDRIFDFLYPLILCTSLFAAQFGLYFRVFILTFSDLFLIWSFHSFNSITLLSFPGIPF